MFVYPKINYGAVMSRGKIFSSLVPGLISQRIKSLSWIQLWYSDTNIDYTLDNPRHGRISSLCNAQQGNSLSKETWLTSSQTKLNHSSIQERPWGFSYRPKNVVKSRLSFDNSLCPVFKLAGYQRTAKDNASTMPRSLLSHLWLLLRKMFPPMWARIVILNKLKWKAWAILSEFSSMECSVIKDYPRLRRIQKEGQEWKGWPIS